MSKDANKAAKYLLEKYYPLNENISEGRIYLYIQYIVTKDGFLVI